jgi:tetratricopeptide (TPR) repeat protein
MMITAKSLLVTLSLLVAFVPAFPQNDGDDLVIGKYRKLHSSVTNEDRILSVWLPRSYEETTLSYPVVCVLYGQNTTAYLMPTITACDMLSAGGAVPEMIVVGLANAERYRDYSSISDGYIENTVKFFSDELFPYIDRNYRTTDFRIVIGPQAGAVFSFYTLIKHPDLFDAYILENPFVGQNRELLYNMVSEYFNKDIALDKFLFIKEEKGQDPANIKTASQFAELMKSKAPAGFRFHFDLEEPSGYFVPPVPAKEGLLRLFEAYKFPDTLKVEKLDDIKRFYQDAGRKYGSDFPPPEHVLTIESDKFLSASKYDEESAVLEYMLSVYPRSLNALMRMGDLKRTLGDYPAAIKYYDEFLKIRQTDVVSIRNRRNTIEKYMNESLIYVLEKDIEAKGIDQAIRNFKKSKASKDNKLTFPENDFNSLGYALLNRGKQAEAIKVFSLALENYPQSSNLYDSRGEAYMRSGDKTRAVKNYEKSLELNPKNENARRVLEQLKGK